MKKKLIEVALPLEAINAACKADKDRKTGHIRNIHKWFAPMPLPALRAILFSSILDAPEDPEKLESVLRLIADLVASGPEHPDSRTLDAAKGLLSRQLGQNQPWILDPFCGGGSTLVEAQRLGLEAEGSDLNPIPVLISRCLTVFPKNYLGRKPLTKNSLLNGEAGNIGLENDIKSYAIRIGQAVWSSLAALYPKAPNGDAVIYWWWAHTVPSPDPAFAHCQTPLVTNWWLSLRSGDHRFLIPEPNKTTGQLHFRIETKGTPPQPSKDRCLFSGAPITYKYVREQALNGRLGRMLLAYVSDGESGRSYWTPDATHEDAANAKFQVDLPSLSIPRDGLGISVQNYGISEWSELFTPRQQKMLSTFAEFIQKIPAWVQADGGTEQYGKDIAQYLGLGLGKLAQASSKIVRLNVRKGPSAKAEPAFARGDIQLNWDFAETNPFGKSVGDWNQVITTALRAFGLIDPRGATVTVKQSDARAAGSDHKKKYIVVTDPPYFAAIGYADLSEYFYYWLRLALKDICPDLFATVGVPKLTELIASPARHGGRSQAAEYFISGFTETFSHLSTIADPEFPIVVVYAQRQEEQSREEGASTGWEAMLEAILRAGLGITGTWPIWGTGSARMRSHDSNSLASYVVLVCRSRSLVETVSSRREFITTLRTELPSALVDLQRANIAPVDLAQAAIGPGMAIFSRYSKVVSAEGNALSVRDALGLINEALDEVLTHQEGDFDSSTRWAVAWFEQFGFGTGEYGVADTLSKAKNTSVTGMVEAGIAASKAGDVRLLRPVELSATEKLLKPANLTDWGLLHLIIRSLESAGEIGAAEIAARVGDRIEAARDLAYRLYAICERKKRAQEAVSYNAAVQSWPEIVRLSRDRVGAQESQAGLFPGREK